MTWLLAVSVCVLVAARIEAQVSASRQAGDTPRAIVSLGAGGYGRTTHMSLLGLDAGVRLVLANSGRVSLTASMDGLLLPNVAGKRAWIVPITIGLRRH